MAQSTTVEDFPAPLTSNSGWRLSGQNEATLGDFRCNLYGDLYYKGAYVGSDPAYGAAVWITAQVSSRGEASAAITLMLP
jgi:hypothetical protein